MATITVTAKDTSSAMEDVFAPETGNSGNKLVLASRKIISYFNKLGDGKFLDASMGHSNNNFRVDMTTRNGAFGHSVMVIDTIHGTLNLVKEPLFRGIAAGFMLMADMSQVSYRPLIGNGINRDTQVMTNVQSADEDLRKDMILTEAGLEVSLSESHALFNLEND